MALTVTVAGASSDSYATEAEADDFLVIKQSATWTNASTALKEAALKTAAALMDELPYRYPKSSTTQALRFPTSDNYESGSYVINDRIKRAQSYLALQLLESGGSLSGGSGDVDSVAVTGSFSVKFATESVGLFDLPQEVESLLGRYLWKSGPSGGPRVWDGASRAWV